VFSAIIALRLWEYKSYSLWVWLASAVRHACLEIDLLWENVVLPILWLCGMTSWWILVWRVSFGLEVRVRGEFKLIFLMYDLSNLFFFFFFFFLYSLLSNCTFNWYSYFGIKALQNLIISFSTVCCVITFLFLNFFLSFFLS